MVREPFAWVRPASKISFAVSASSIRLSESTRRITSSPDSARRTAWARASPAWRAWAAATSSAWGASRFQSASSSGLGSTSSAIGSGPVRLARQLAGDLAQQRGAGLAALAVDERLAAGRRQQQIGEAEALALAAEAAAAAFAARALGLGGGPGGGRLWSGLRGRRGSSGRCGCVLFRRALARRAIPGLAVPRRAVPGRPIRGRALAATARRPLPFRRPLASRLRLGLRGLAVEQLLDQLLPAQHPVAGHVRLGGEGVQFGDVLGIQLCFGHRCSRLLQGVDG